MPTYVRVIICTGMMLAGGFVGFWPVEFLADALLSPSAGPTPYGDWRPVVYGLFAGVPLGAVCGLLLAIWLTWPRKGDAPKQTKWLHWLGIGLAVGIAVGFLFSGTPLVDLPILGRLAWFAICGVVGAAAFTAGAFLWRRFR